MDFIAWQYKRFHVSYLLTWLASGVLVGLVAGRHYAIDTGTLFLCIGLILLLGGLRSRRFWALPVVACAGLSFGLIRGSAVVADYGHYHQLAGRQVTMTGTLSGDSQTASSGRQKLTLTNICVRGQHYPGAVFVTTYGKTDLKRGDTVTLSGTVREGFASYGAAISSGKVLKVVRGEDVIRDIREHFGEAVRTLVMEPMASLGLGFVVGQRSTLPDTLDEQLKVVGLTHIVVASGYNLTILVRFMMRLLSRHSRYLAFTASLLMIAAFVLFSGFSPSMNRAVVVTVLSLLAWYVGRRFHPLMLIIYVAAATAFTNPMYIWADLGWFLSFFAFGGVLIVAPLVMRQLYRGREPSSFEQLIAETVCAELAALPLVAFSFSSVPTYALFANVLVAPFIPAAMVLTALTGAIGMVSMSLATIAALPTTILIGYMVAVVEWVANLPAAQLELQLGIWPVLSWYVALVVVCVLIWQRTRYNFRTPDSQLEV